MNERIKRPLAGCLVCVGCLGLLALLAYEVGSVGRFDADLLLWLAVSRESSLGDLAELISFFGDPLPQLALLVIACLLALRWGRPRHAVAAIVLVVGANLTTQILKAVLSHPRYQLALGYRQVSSTSFPSGHATAALAIAYAFVLIVPSAWKGWALLAGLAFGFALGCSVVALHYHYPSDVLGGWLIASAWFFGVVAALRVREPRLH